MAGGWQEDPAEIRAILRDGAAGLSSRAMGVELELSQLCGQLLVVGFPGTELPGALSDALAAGTRGGVILFKRNVPSVEVAHELCSATLDAAPDDLPPFVGVDQEGGRVARLPVPALKLPPMRELGKIGDPDLVKRVATVVARELAAIGFNIDFAPVLDVDSNPKNPIIGDRAFGSEPDTVARLGRAFIAGLQENGVLACGKHFPGHGDTNKDSHLELPVVARSKERLDEVELPPFRVASHSGVAALMSAHVVYSELDPGVPATLSRAICTGLLRGELGFQGVLFSDDLEMKALAKLDPGGAAVAAVRAGCDALLVCSDADVAERVHAALVEKAESDAAFRRRCAEAATRCLAARRRTPPRPVPGAAELADAFDSVEAKTLLAEIETRRG